MLSLFDSVSKAFQRATSAVDALTEGTLKIYKNLEVYGMNLAEYAALPKTNGAAGEFLKWTKNGETKLLRFLYTSRDGSDIDVRRKKWDDDEKKYVYDTPDGKLTCVLNAVLYENGQPPKRVRWERSASFTEQACNGYWSKFPRIIDGVWEVTCTNPGTKEIKFAWFPVMGADLTNYPLPEGVSLENGQLLYTDVPATTPGDAHGSGEDTVSKVASYPDTKPAGARKYWE